MLREVASVTAKEFRNIVGQQIYFPADGFGLVGLNAPESKVAMEATSHALKEFLVRLPCGGKNEGIIPGKATDKTMTGSQRIDRTRIDIIGRDMLWTPDLTGCVITHGSPLGCGHSGELPVEEYETFRQVSVIVIRTAGSESGEDTKPNTRLYPVGLGAFVRRIMGAEAKIDFIIAGRNRMIHD